MELTKEKLANMIDHTYLKPFAVKADFEKLCQEAMDYNFKMVAINSYPVKQCREFLKDSPVHVGAAIGFPLGQTTIATKVFEVQDAIDNGADEIDYVINITEVKAGNWDYLRSEMQQIVEVCRKHKILSKVIFENCFLTKEEIKKMSEIAAEVKPDFIKTSTGFGTSGATIEDVSLMYSIVKGACEVKAAGGIRDWPTCKAMIEAGATRIGATASIKIVEGFEAEMQGKPFTVNVSEDTY